MLLVVIHLPLGKRGRFSWMLKWEYVKNAHVPKHNLGAYPSNSQIQQPMSNSVSHPAMLQSEQTHQAWLYLPHSPPRDACSCHYGVTAPHWYSGHNGLERIHSRRSPPRRWRLRLWQEKESLRTRSKIKRNKNREGDDDTHIWAWALCREQSLGGAVSKNHSRGCGWAAADWHIQAWDWRITV